MSRRQDEVAETQRGIDALTRNVRANETAEAKAEREADERRQRWLEDTMRESRPGSFVGDTYGGVETKRRERAAQRDDTTPEPAPDALNEWLRDKARNAPD